jgi:sirohydrochlorin ferrochelatase
VGDPVMIACAHGTRVAAGRRTMARLRLDVAALRPGLEVLAAAVDVQKPALADVVARCVRAGRSAVVVPLLLSAGYHVHADVAAAVEAGEGLVRAARALGPDPALAAVLHDRLTGSGAGSQDTVVLAAAGSSDPRAQRDVQEVAALLAARRRGPVLVGYLSAAPPTVAQALCDARGTGRPVWVATYLLAEGIFAGRLAEVAGARLTAPLAPHPELARLVLRRYDEVAGS